MQHPYETKPPMKHPYETPPEERGLPNILVGNEHAELPTGTSRPSSALISDEESGSAGPLGDLSSKSKNLSKR